MKDHLYNIEKALKSIGKDYFKTPSITNKPFHLERVFAYEFYHQLRLLYDDSKHFVHGELGKRQQFFPLNRKATVYPDIIIHSLSNSYQDNSVVIEIKSGPRIKVRQLIDDLSKLKDYTNQKSASLKYKKGIFLIINCNFKEYFSSRRKGSQSEILSYLKEERIEIWNIDIGYNLSKYDKKNNYKIIS